MIRKRDEMQVTRVTRYHVPTKFDHAPHGTQWLALIKEEETELYIQVGENDFSPSWIRMNKFLEKALTDYLDNERFMNDCLKWFARSANKLELPPSKLPLL